ncbi:MAG: hypothetical protein ABIQ86_01290 [Steroidobacteraceae bacterium]
MATTAEKLSNISGRAEDAVQKKGSQLGKFLDDVEDLLRHVTPLQDSDISRARQRVESSINSVRTTAERGITHTVESTKAAAKATDSFVHERPWTAIGIAAVAGALIASLIRSK